MMLTQAETGSNSEKELWEDAALEDHPVSDMGKGIGFSRAVPGI